jgi:hypothetical protein
VDRAPVGAVLRRVILTERSEVDAGAKRSPLRAANRRRWRYDGASMLARATTRLSGAVEPAEVSAVVSLLE